MSVDKSGTSVKQMFSDIASRYDFMNHLLSLNMDRYWRRRTVQLVPAKVDGGPILDVCTGTGDLAFAYWKRSQGQIPVTATDFCPEMLAYGEAKKAKLGINGQVTFLEADSQQLPFDDARFQIVSVAFGLRNVEDTGRGLDEMVRVCQPGGRVAILEFSQPTWQPFKWMYSTYFRHLLPRLGQWMASNRSAYEYLPQSVAEFPSGDALAAKMREAGLRDVWQRAFTCGIVTLYVGTR